LAPCIAATALFYAWLLVAQAPIGNISGVVKDPSGAVVSGARVNGTSVTTGASRTSGTDEQGYFLLSTLQPGDYKVEVTSPGFATAIIERVTVEVGQTAHIEVPLTLSTASTEIQVVTRAVNIESERATVTGVVTTRQIDQLPLNGRNYLELA